MTAHTLAAVLLSVMAASAAIVQRGQSSAEVLELMGLPDSIAGDEHPGATADNTDQTWRYRIGCQAPEESCAITIITFSHGNVRKVKRVHLSHVGPGKLDEFLGTAAIVYLAWRCPRIRSRPVMLLNSYEAELMPACVAAGF